MPSNKVKSSNPGKTIQPMEIRKPRPGEACRRTGNMQAHYCLKTQEYVSDHITVAHEYHLLSGPALLGWGVSPLPTMFHDMISETSGRFALPQVIAHDPLLPEGWQKCEREMLSYDLRTWTYIDYGEDLRSFEVGVRYHDDINLNDYQDFDQQLAASLSPYIINSVDHPLIQRLHLLFCDLDDDTIPMEWAHVA
jgi:hypothetical protein